MGLRASLSERMRTRQGRSLLYILRIALIGAAAWAFFTWIVDDAQLFLDYLKVLVWPIALLCVAVLFREVLGEKFRQLARLDVPGARVDFRESAARELGDSLHEDLETLSGFPEVKSAPSVNDSREETVVDTEQRDKDSTVAADAPVEAQANQASPTAAPPEASKARELQRESVESIIQKSADWGYRLGRSGSPQAVPDIEWSSDGSWQIATDIPRNKAGSVVRSSSTDTLRSIVELEKEIKAIEKRKHSMFGVSAISTLQDQGWLVELKRRLGRVDPGNPWAD